MATKTGHFDSGKGPQGGSKGEGAVVYGPITAPGTKPSDPPGLNALEQPKGSNVKLSRCDAGGAKKPRGTRGAMTYGN